MINHYPPPSYAATIWLSGDTIMLSLPEASTIQFPLSRPHAIDALITVLRARMVSHSPSIGEPAAQVRNDVEKALESDEKYKAWLVNMSENKVTKAEAKEFLFGLGL